MDSSERTRQLVPVFVEKTDGQDIRDLLYFRGEDGELRRLAELKPVDSAEFPGVVTTSIVETTNAAGGKTITSVSVSPFSLCCVVIGGTKICYLCP